MGGGGGGGGMMHWLVTRVYISKRVVRGVTGTLKTLSLSLSSSPSSADAMSLRLEAKCGLLLTTLPTPRLPILD